MNRQEKEAFVADMNARLQEARAVFLADFTGVSVNQNQALRSALRGADVEMTVVKNSLFLLAVEGTPFAGLMDEHMVGPNAVILANDVVGGAKALKTFMKEREDVPLKVKGGALAETALSAAEIDTLASLPSREQLIGQFVGLLQTPLRNFAALLQAPLRDFVGAMKALEAKKSE